MRKPWLWSTEIQIRILTWFATYLPRFVILLLGSSAAASLQWVLNYLGSMNSSISFIELLRELEMITYVKARNIADAW
jgi:hypothetical protein